MSDTKQQILDYVYACDHSPSVREIAEAIGVASPATVHRHLTALYYEGKLERSVRGNRIIVKRQERP